MFCLALGLVTQNESAFGITTVVWDAGCPVSNTQGSFLSLDSLQIRAESWQLNVLLPKDCIALFFILRSVSGEGTPLLVQQKHFHLRGWKGVNFLHSELDLIISKFISVWLTFLDFFSESLKGWRSCAYSFRSCHQWLKQHPAEESVIHQIFTCTFFFFP